MTQIHEAFHIFIEKKENRLIVWPDADMVIAFVQNFLFYTEARLVSCILLFESCFLFSDVSLKNLYHQFVELFQSFSFSVEIK